MGLKIVKEVLDPNLTKTGHGLYLSDENLLFVGSRCCGYPMNKVSTVFGGMYEYACMKDKVDKAVSYYESSVNITQDPNHDYDELGWALDNWASSWTGLSEIQVKITYM